MGEMHSATPTERAYGAAMIAHGLMMDHEAAHVLAASYADPVRLAVGIAAAARDVLAMTASGCGVRPDLFSLDKAYAHALSLARDGLEVVDDL